MASVRLAALDSLLAVERDGKPLHLETADVLRAQTDWSGQERAFYQRLVRGVTESKLRLDHLLDQVSDTKTAKMKPVIRMILRLGVYQIEEMDAVPDAAAVNESVKLVGVRGPRGLRGFVNGVLRGFLRKREKLAWPDGARDPDGYLSVTYSVPRHLVSGWCAAYGAERTERICASFAEAPPLTVRLRGSDPDATERELKEAGVAVSPAPYEPTARILAGAADLAQLPAFADGRITVQDVSSMLAVRAAGIRPGDAVLDLCAAPGGKSLFAADLTGETGSVTARDVSEKKAALLRSTMQRAGAEKVSIEVRDATVFDPDAAGAADVVLADVPCSGLGVIGRKPDIRYNASDEKTEALAALSREILANAVRYVRPGGVLVFSTCTFDPRENEENAAWICAHSDLVPDALAPHLPEALRGEVGEGHMLQLFPGIHQCDGFFIARFVRPM